MYKYMWIKMWTLVLLVSIMAGVGCSEKAKTPSAKPRPEKEESKDLSKVQRNIDILQGELEKEYFRLVAPTPAKPSVPEEEEEAKKEDKEGSKGEEAENNGDMEEGGDEEDEGDNSGDGGDSPSQQTLMNFNISQQKPDIDWNKLDGQLRKVHEGWNKLQPDLSKVKAEREKIKDFSRKLDILTLALTDQNIYKGLMASNELNFKSAAFEKYFKTQVPNLFKEVIYSLNKGTYQVLQAELEPALASLHRARSTWKKVRPEFKDHELLSQFEFSLEELEQAIKSQDPNLVKIRFQTCKDNVQGIIKQSQKGDS